MRERWGKAAFGHRQQVVRAVIVVTEGSSPVGFSVENPVKETVKVCYNGVKRREKPSAAHG